MKFKIACMLTLVAMSLSLSGVAKAEPVTKEVALNLHDVFIPEKIDKGADAKIIVSGMFPNSCYRWSRARVHDSSTTTHQIQGYALVTETMCLMVLVPYSKEVNLGKLAPGEHTLRFVNGDDTYFERTLVVE
jgi:hypothetical protein